MGFFAAPYRVLTQDSTETGWQHFLTGFKFQCEAREHFFFAHCARTEAERRSLEDFVLVTRDGYARTLAPVAAGERVGVLVTQEDVNPSSARCCFRVVRADGTPVSAGFQTLIATTRAGEVVPGPEAIRRHGPSVREKLCAPSFAERILSGTGLDRVFDEEAIRLGKAAAAGPGEGQLPASFGRVLPENALAFLFPARPGSGRGALADLAAAVPGGAALVARTREVVRAVLGASLEEAPGPGAYLEAVLAARRLMERGERPDLLVGHGAGELAALAVAGAIDIEAGIEAAARRALVLRAAAGTGGLVALACHEKRARALLGAVALPTLEVALVDSADETVVSGGSPDLAKLLVAAERAGLGATRLEEDVPLPSRLLEPCVAPLREALAALSWRDPAIPVYSTTERDLHASADAMPALLASHLARPIVLHEIFSDLHQLGARRFVEVGRDSLRAAPATGEEPPPPWDLSPRRPAPVAVARVEGPRAAAIALVEAPSGERAPLLLRERRVLVLCDRPEWLATPRGRDLLGALARPTVAALDLSSDEALARSASCVEGHDAILAVTDLGEDPVARFSGRAPLLEMLLGAARAAYERIASGEVPLAALALSAWRPGHQLHPATGLLAGFAKSLARELPGARIKVVASDEDPVLALARLETELGGSAWPVEVAFRGGRRFVSGLVPIDEVSVGATLLGPDSVVLATGGARGVTAVLVEALLEEHGASFVLVGRTDPGSVPPALRELDDGAFDAREPAYYESELARGAPLAELRARWRTFRAAREVAATLHRLGARASYVRCDVTDAAAVSEAVGRVARERGRIDLVLHGAGVQTSKLLPKRTLDELRVTLATKLDGVANLRRALGEHLPGAPPHWHILTSIAGHLGNAGQSDYAAANAALDRLAACETASDADWSTVAWLGWEGVGMGSGYRSVAEASGTRWLSRDEGKRFFARLMKGRPVAASTALFREEDAARLPGLVLEAARGPLGAAREFELSTRTLPFVGDHLVGGVPTIPGAFFLELALRAAIGLRPALRGVRIEDADFRRFLRVAKPVVLRSVARVLSETPEETVVLVRLLSDVVHASGRVLAKDVEHVRSLVVLGRPGPLVSTRVEPNGPAQELRDPYAHPLSPVKVSGPFAALRGVSCRERTTSGVYRPEGAPPRELAGAFSPTLLLDALFRAASTSGGAGATVPILAPVHCTRLELAPDCGVADAEPALLLASPIRIDRETGRSVVDWAEARALDGRVIARGEQLLGRLMGEVEVERVAPVAGRS